MKKKQYVSPKIIIYRIAMEDVVAQTQYMIRFGNTGIEADEWIDNTAEDAGNDIVLIF
ncbi:MAG: hypothetical protein LBS46_02380 [Dysgonamonadaceae bacterium]|jgi:hypothetical protein|nr:hypothetical protein [Dysgonamonadaceae bacterium]